MPENLAWIGYLDALNLNMFVPVTIQADVVYSLDGASVEEHIQDQGIHLDSAQSDLIAGAVQSALIGAPDGTLPQIGSPEMADLFTQIRPTLCIIDTLQHFIGGASANDMSAITTALQPLQYLARFHNTAVVVVMPISNKYAAQSNSGDSTSFSIGSYAIAGIFRTLWTLGRLKEESGKPAATRALCVSKNNYAEFDPPTLPFELRDGFRWTGVDFNLIAENLYNKKKNKGRPAEKRDDVKAQILRLLDGGEPMLSAELEAKVCELTGCHANTIATAKKNWAWKVLSPENMDFHFAREEHKK